MVKNPNRFVREVRDSILQTPLYNSDIYLCSAMFDEAINTESGVDRIGKSCHKHNLLTVVYIIIII